MKIAIATDSGSGISQREGKELGIFVLALPISVNGDMFYEGKDLSYEEFYKYLDFNNEVSTSQPSPGELMEFWDSILEQDYDKIVYIPISIGFSSSYTTANLLAQEERYKDKVQVVNNHRISVTQLHACLSGRNLVEKGLSAKEIKEKLEADGGDSVIFIGFDTLDYLEKGGRLILSTVARMGNLLNIRPLVVLKEDKPIRVEITRGTKQGKKKMLQLIKEYMDKVKDLGEDYYLSCGGTFKDKDKAQEWYEMVKDLLVEEDFDYENLSCSVATHTGPDAFGFAISKK